LIHGYMKQATDSKKLSTRFEDRIPETGDRRKEKEIRKEK